MILTKTKVDMQLAILVFVAKVMLGDILNKVRHRVNNSRLV
jgi:hypothetical protein